jgi:hypothetical protein
VTVTATVREINIGVRRYLATCPDHPDWRPGSRYDQLSAQSDVTSHEQSWLHDGIDYSAMPPYLIRAITDVHDRQLRLRLARGAKLWKDTK